MFEIQNRKSIVVKQKSLLHIMKESMESIVPVKMKVGRLTKETMRTTCFHDSRSLLVGLLASATHSTQLRYDP